MNAAELTKRMLDVVQAVEHGQPDDDFLSAGWALL